MRALGGRSLLWGGWMVEPEEANWNDARSLGAPWPVSLQELAPDLKRLKKEMNVRQKPLAPQFKRAAKNLKLKWISKPGALKKSTNRVLHALDLLKAGAPLRLNTRVEKIIKNPDGTWNLNGLKCRRVVLAASPLETAGILLRSRLQSPAFQNPWIGKNLTDHLVSSALLLMPVPAPSKRYPKPLENAALIPRRSARQKSRLRFSLEFSMEIKGPISCVHLGASALKQLELSPAKAKRWSYIAIHALGEGDPNAGRTVKVGRQGKLKVDWKWSSLEKKLARQMNNACEEIAEELAAPGSELLWVRDALTPACFGSIAHESGTARMAKSKKHGVVNSWGQVFNEPSVLIADASMMPTGLDRHPSLTLGALALRVAKKAIESLKMPHVS